MTNGTQKKGLSPIAWIAIGCGALVLVGGLALAGLLGFGLFKAKEFASEMEANPAKVMAETAVRLNPDLELVESDDEAGTITFRDKKSGEISTMNFEDIAEGKFSITTAEGEFSVDASASGGEGGVTIKGPEGEARFGAGAALDDVPDWVPIYPGATQAQGTYNAVTAEGVSGIVTATTGDGVREVIDYYKKKLEDEGYEIAGQTSSSTPQGSFASLTGTLAAQGRTVNVVVGEQEGETQVTINYNGKAE